MITVLSLNSAMDRVLPISRLQPGRVHRAEECTLRAAGKGYNVARFLHRLGAPVQLVTFAGGAVGDYLQQQAGALDMAARFVRTEQESRMCYLIVDRTMRKTTVINEPGPLISPAEVTALLWQLDQCWVRGGILVMSGSLPRGVPPDIYRQLVLRARQHGVRSLVDARGEPLRLAAEAHPWVLKANREELGELYGGAGTGAKAVREMTRRALAAGAGNVVVTLGARGAALRNQAGFWRYLPPAVHTVDATGSGDAFTAGMVAGAVRSQPLDEAARQGVACGTANVLTLGPELPADLDLNRLLHQVRVRRYPA